jgi:hypothetical protein
MLIESGDELAETVFPKNMVENLDPTGSVASGKELLRYSSGSGFLQGRFVHCCVLSGHTFYRKILRNILANS